MSQRPVISSRAEADLTLQYQWYLDHAGLDVAERYLNAFDETIHRLAGRPGLGRLRNFKSRELTGVRSLPIGGRFGAHLVFYRDTGSFVSIERVMHGARNLPRRLLEPPGDQPHGDPGVA